jgi:hypothetical protein
MIACAAIELLHPSLALHVHHRLRLVFPCSPSHLVVDLAPTSGNDPMHQSDSQGTMLEGSLSPLPRRRTHLTRSGKALESRSGGSPEQALAPSYKAS